MQGTKDQPDGAASSVVPWARKLYASPSELTADAAELHHAFLVHKTLKGGYDHLFKPDSVFYVGRSPSAYIKKVTRVSEPDIQKWQRFLWNQAVVPMLIVQCPTQVRVYTAYTRPMSSAGGNESLAHILRDTADALQLDRLLAEIEAGAIYHEKPELFRRSQTVDRDLLNNLNYAANKLAGALMGDDEQEKLQFVHRFLTRLLFVCYLIERGMIKGEHFGKGPLTKLRARSSDTEGGYVLHDLFRDLGKPGRQRKVLYDLFAHIKSRFNGSLFPVAIATEKKQVSDDFISIVDNLLQGHDIATHQLSFGFLAYDFSVIPIELISAIYEGFLGPQGEIDETAGRGNSRRSTGAYYTPPHLAEMTVDIALENVDKPIHELRVLDPACGSGVFLVCLFNRMAGSLGRKEKAGYSQKAIQAERLFVLLRQLCGLDVSEVACHITCFSLYLAVLEHLYPMDVEELQKKGKKLPGLLACVPCSSDKYDSIINGNLFDPKDPLRGRRFDVIVGNPPWVSRDKQRDKLFLSWRDQGAPKVRAPDKQIAHGFMWKAPEYLADFGHACFLLSAKVLLNGHTNNFQEKWFKRFAVDRVVNFADLRKFVFPGAKNPCVAIRFSQTPPDGLNAIRLESPKTDWRNQQGGRVFIREEDTSSVNLGQLLYAASAGHAPVMWKSRFWGTPRDRRLLDRLRTLSRLCDVAGDVRGDKPWKKGQGIILGQASRLGWWHPDWLFLGDSNEVSFAVVPGDCQTVRQSGFSLKAHRPRREELFRGPKVLISQGAKDMKVAFCDVDVIFQDWLQTITGPAKDADMLRFLSVVLKSDTVQYYLFHTAANWGTERDKVHTHELLSVPFFLPEDATDRKRAQQIVKEVATAVRKFEKKYSVKAFQLANRLGEAKSIRRHLEPLIREYYDIDKYEGMLIDDTVETIIPSSTPMESTPNIPTLREVSREHCKRYANTLTGMLTKLTREKRSRFFAEVLQGTPYSVVRLTIANRSLRATVVDAPKELTKVLKRMEHLLQRQQGRFVFCQNLKVFDGGDLYVLKPMQRRFWTRTAALNDADEIAGAIAMANEGRQ